MSTYKFRAEGMADALKFVKMFGRKITEYRIIANTSKIDVECEFETNKSLNDILKTMWQIPDGHVMRETVKPISKYTGVRE